MQKNSIDYFNKINNFNKIKLVESILVYGKIGLTKPKVTILIPTYKREDLLRESIDSALNQFFYDDYQIIVIDNNPERNCETEKLIKTIDNKKILHYKNNTNIGMFGNWNRGFELSKSEWTVLLHDDDIISPYFLTTCSKFFHNKSIAIIKPEIIKFSNQLELNFNKPDNFKLYRYYLLDFIFGCSIGAPTNILYNTSKLIASGGFNQDHFPCADYVSSANIAKDYKVYKLKCVLGGYRVSDNESLNSNTMSLYFENKFYISSFLIKFFKIPDYINLIIQSSWIEYSIKGTNTFYNIKIKYDYQSNLGLIKLNYIIKNAVYIFCRIFMILMNLFRRVLK
jgi:glycosyltransferase involved in cell wall biosynthesis